mgnify:CR=1 FL=1
MRILMRFISHKKLCNEDRCLVYANGKALYKDNDHLRGGCGIRAGIEPVFAGRGLPVLADITPGVAVQHEFT